MPYVDPRPLPVAPDWEIDVRCPHGVTIRGDLDLVRSYQPLEDPCEAAVAERAAGKAEAAERRLSRAERREASELHQLWVAFRFRRQLKRLTGRFDS